MNTPKLHPSQPLAALPVSSSSTVVQAVRAIWQRGDPAVFLRLLHPTGAIEEYRYADLVERGLCWSHYYARMGLRPGAHVVVILQHSFDLYAAYLGALLARMVPAMFAFPSAKHSLDDYARTIGQLLDNAHPELVVTYPELKRQLTEILPANQATLLACPSDEVPGTKRSDFTSGGSSEDAAFLQFSSGTTGLKKGVIISHRALLWQVESYRQAIGADERDRIASWLPLYHDMGLICCFFLPMLTGIPITAISPFDWVKRPGILLRAISDYRATLCWLPNFAYNFLAKNSGDEDARSLDLSSLRGVVNCSEPVMASSHDRFLERFSRCGFKPSALAASYAMAETTFAVTSGGFDQPLMRETISARVFTEKAQAVPVTESATDARTLVSSGVALPETRIQILDEDGRDLPERHVGEIAVQSPSLMGGYHLNPTATSKSLKAGRLLTGDLGYMADGHLFVTGRKKDLIIIAGKNLYPQDIEDAVSQVTGVIPGRVVVFGISDPTQGTEQLVVVAESEEKDPAKAIELTQTIFDVVAAQTEVVPADIRLVAHMWLVKSTSGKLSRGANQQRYLELVQSETAKRSPSSASGTPGMAGQTQKADPGRVHLSETITECVQQTLRQKNRVLPPDFGPTTRLIKGGLIDSLSIVTLVLELESKLKLRIPESLLETRNFDSIANIVEVLLSLGNRSDAIPPLVAGAAARDGQPAPTNGAVGFDGYVSLGFNCEPALQFKRIGYEGNGFFSYTWASYDSVVQLIKNDFEGVFLKENLVPHTDELVRDTRHNVIFHAGLRSIVESGSGIRRFSGGDFDELYRLFYSLTIQHLIKKWQTWVSSDQQVLYILKLEGGNGRARALELRRLFDVKYPKHQATILCLQTEQHREPDWQVPGLANRYLPAFAPFDNAHAADFKGWDQIFAEFPLKAKPAINHDSIVPVISSPMNTPIDQGRAALNAGDWLAAQTALLQCLACEPNHAEAHLLLGHARLNLNELALALESYLAFARLCPNISVAHSCCALTQQLLGRSGEADASADRALGLNAADVVALKVKARVALDRGLLEPAATYCEQVLRTDPNDQDARLMAEECRTQSQSAVASTPTLPPPLADAHTTQRDWSSATNDEIRVHLQTMLNQVGFRRLQQAGFHVQRNDYYSPLNDCDFLEANPDLWSQPPTVPAGIDWRIEEQMAVVRDVARHVEELRDVPSVPQDDQSRFAWNNNYWNNADAMVQYGLVRSRRPKRYVEIGCGWSSLLLKRAMERNASEGVNAEVTLIEPYPNNAIFKHLPASWKVHRTILQRADFTLFESLGEGDVLFYDGSHCSKPASDVNWFFFRVLPRIKPGVIIHIHDIAMPHEYPAPWIFERGQTWNEQYVLQAFLMHNCAYRVLVANRFLSIHRHAELERLYRGIQPVHGSSFWMQKINP